MYVDNNTCYLSVRMDNDNKKKPVSLEQLTLLLEAVEKDPWMSSSKGSDRTQKLMYFEKWQTLSKTLNSVENGVKKNFMRWQKLWRDWKSNTKKKAIKYGDKSSQELSSLEMRLIHLSKGEPPNVEPGAIEISSVIEVDSLTSDNSTNELKDQVSVYTTVDNENESAAEPEDEVIIKKKRIQFPDDITKQQTGILSRITALEEPRRMQDTRHIKVLEDVVVALDQQADTVSRQGRRHD